jgi:hypothetical protein
MERSFPQLVYSTAQRLVRCSCPIVFCAVFFASFAAHCHAQPATPGVRREEPKSVFTPEQVGESGGYTRGVYRNGLLGFSLSIPSEWKLMSEEFNKAIPAAGGEILKERQSPEERKAFETTILNTKVLFTAELAPGVTFGAAVEFAPIDWTLRKYSEYNRNVLLGTFPHASLQRNLYEKVYGATSLTGFDLEHTLADRKLKQIYLITQRKGVFLFFVATYWTEEQRKSIDAALTSLSFDK